jgi:hypothetical protein
MFLLLLVVGDALNRTEIDAVSDYGNYRLLLAVMQTVKGADDIMTVFLC